MPGETPRLLEADPFGRTNVIYTTNQGGITRQIIAYIRTLNNIKIPIHPLSGNEGYRSAHGRGSIHVAKQPFDLLCNKSNGLERAPRSKNSSETADRDNILGAENQIHAPKRPSNAKGRCNSNTAAALARHFAYRRFPPPRAFAGAPCASQAFTPRNRRGCLRPYRLLRPCQLRYGRRGTSARRLRPARPPPLRRVPGPRSRSCPRPC